MMFRHSGMAVAVIGPDGRAALRPVTITRDLGFAVEIVGGLGPGDRVIDNPPDSIENGEAVHIASTATARNG
jgi:hypothetical protein